MSIGVVDDSEFNIELGKGANSPVPKLRPAQIINSNANKGRKEGDNNVPDSLRKVIGEEAISGDRSSALQLAKMFDVSPASVSAYSKGSNSTSTYHKKNKELLTHLNNSKLKLAHKASRKLRAALENITEDKLEDANVKDLAIVAKSMSGIIKDMTTTETDSSTVSFNGPSIVMYNPGFRKEDSFETIELDETA